jgi:hypothetical protein
MQTIPIQTAPNEDQLAQIRAQSTTCFTRPRAQVEAEIQARYGQQYPDDPLGEFVDEE